MLLRKFSFVAAALALLAAGARADEEKKTPDPTVIRPIEVVPIVGRKSTTLYHEKAAKVPSILHIWATWCGPCRTELPDYFEFSKRKEFSSDGEYVFMSAVAWADEMDSIVRFLTLLPCDVQKRTTGRRVFMVLKEGDLDHPDAKYLALGTFPTTLFINADGTIAKRVEGTIEWNSRKTRKGVRNFVRGKPFEIKQ